MVYCTKKAKSVAVNFRLWFRLRQGWKWQEKRFRTDHHFRKNDHQLDIKEKNTVTFSISEVEYQVLSEFEEEAVLTQNLVEELTGQRKPAIIYEDNLGTIFLVRNQQVSSRTKHIDIRHHFMRDLQDKKELDVRF
jgi:hypothetical protein